MEEENEDLRLKIKSGKANFDQLIFEIRQLRKELNERQLRRRMPNVETGNALDGKYQLYRFITVFHELLFKRNRKIIYVPTASEKITLLLSKAAVNFN